MRVLDIFKEAYRFTAGNVGRLAVLTAVPAVIFIVAGGLGEYADAIQNPNSPSVSLGLLIFIIAIVDFLAGTYIGLKVSRTYLAQRGIQAVATESRSFLWYVLYTIAVAVIGLVPALVGVALAIFLVAAGNALVGIVIAAPFVVVTFYMIIRFGLALPAVALGHRPNVFSYMWSFGGPIAWRFAGWSLVPAAVLVVIHLVLWLIFSGSTGGGASAFVAGIRGLILNAATLPVVWWFIMCAYCEAYARLSESARHRPA